MTIGILNRKKKLHNNFSGEKYLAKSTPPELPPRSGLFQIGQRDKRVSFCNKHSCPRILLHARWAATYSWARSIWLTCWFECAYNKVAIRQHALQHCVSAPEICRGVSAKLYRPFSMVSDFFFPQPGSSYPQEVHDKLTELYRGSRKSHIPVVYRKYANCIWVSGY
jgi:hypothetical protein